MGAIEIIFWIILIFVVLAILIPVIVGMVTRSFLKAKYDSKIEYLKKLKNKDT